MLLLAKARAAATRGALALAHATREELGVAIEHHALAAEGI